MKRILAQLVPSRRAARTAVPARRRQRGTILLITAMMMTSMLGMMAMAIDIGFLFSARQQIQNGLNAAALAGATGLRVTIENDASLNPPQQNMVIDELAIKYAGLNRVNRKNESGGAGGDADNPNRIILTGGDVVVQQEFDPLRVQVRNSMEVPTFFAGIFGLNKVNLSATATASIFPVDGGTGTMASGSVGGANGCWRPLMFPDSFFDTSGIVTLVQLNPDGVTVRKPQAGEYYRSRFGGGARNAAPFVEAPPGGASGFFVTGLRDTALRSDVAVKTVMGQTISFQREVYRLAKFDSLPRVTVDALTLSNYVRFGYCGQIRVGDILPVYARDDFSSLDQVRIKLQEMVNNYFDNIAPDLRERYRYIKSSPYPDPNTHPTIIPVLLYSPVEWTRAGQENGDFTQLRVTNIGLFYLQNVTNNGTITGFFVREIIGGGTPIAPENMQLDAPPSFQQSWLPMAVRVLK
jgi:hypothetical protein